MGRTEYRRGTSPKPEIRIATAEGGVVDFGIVAESTDSDEVRYVVPSLAEALKSISIAVATIARELSDQSVPPDGLDMEFGISISAEGGPVVSANHSQGAFKVTAIYRRNQDQAT